MRGSSFRQAVETIVGVDGVAAPTRCSARTRTAVERLFREGNREALVGELCTHVSRAEAEDLFQRSVERVLSGRCRAEHVGGVHAWVRQDAKFALSHLLDQRRMAERKLRLQGAALPRQDELPEPDEDLARAGNVELARRLVQEAHLSDIDQKLVRLYWGERLPRKEVANELGLPEGTVKKRLARAGATFESVLIKRCGGGCGSPEEEYVRAYAFQHRGNVQQLAVDHMETCEACSRLFGRLEQVRLAVASLAPLPAAKLDRLDQLHRAALHVKEQLVDRYVRTMDLAPLSGARTGAGAALITGCLAAAGGATYCVEQDVDLIGGVRRVIAAARHEPSRPAPHAKAAQVAPAPMAPIVPAPVQTPAPVVAPPTPAPTQKPEPAPQPAPVPQEEYEPMAVAASAPSAPPRAQPTTSSTPSRPVRAPTGGPGEFDGP
ncbi:MAG: Sigma-70, region 4 [Thermoleophilaceae bacterium]|nr:Sigma-70, region 4 [Thermoleophilaceae bacterium]